MRGQLAKLIFSGPIQMTPDAFRMKIGELGKWQEELEVTFASLSAKFAQEGTVSRVDTAQVADVLPKGSVLIEFAETDIFALRRRKLRRRRMSFFSPEYHDWLAVFLRKTLALCQRRHNGLHTITSYLSFMQETP